MAEEMKVKKEPTLPTGRFIWLILAVVAVVFVVSPVLAPFGISGNWTYALVLLAVYFVYKFSTAGGSLLSGMGSAGRYNRLVAWVEDNTPAKFDGSQPPEEVEDHLEAKLADFKKQGWSEERLAGFKWFVESRMYENLLKKN